MFATVKHIVFSNHLLTVLVSAPIFFGFQVHGHDLTAVLSVVLSESLTLQTLALGPFPWGTEERQWQTAELNPSYGPGEKTIGTAPWKQLWSKKQAEWKKKIHFHFSSAVPWQPLWQLRNRKQFPGSCTKVKWSATHLLPWGWSCVMISWVSQEVMAEGWGHCH